MVDLHDLGALLDRAYGLEKSEPKEAHARYEVAERLLEQHLITAHGITQEHVLQHPSSAAATLYLGYIQRIQEGYKRLNPL